MPYKNLGSFRKAYRADKDTFEYNKSHNLSKDYKQYTEWKNILGDKEMPKSLAEFQNLKYNNSDKFEVLGDYKKSIESGAVSPLIGVTDKLKKASKEAGLSIFVDSVKDGIQFAANNVGTYTGNTVLQNKVNLGMKAVGYGMMIAANPVLGSLNLLSNMVFNSLEHSQKKNEEDNALEQLRARAGVGLYRGR